MTSGILQIIGWGIMCVGGLGGIIYGISAQSFGIGFFLIVASVFSGCLTLGFASLVSDVHDMSNDLRSALDLIRQNSNRQPSYPVSNNASTTAATRSNPTSNVVSSEPAYTPVPVSNTANATANNNVPKHSDEKIHCPKCGLLQNGDRTVCWSCGAKFPVYKY